MAYLPVGIVLGCLYALTAVGLVVTYNTSGIFNLAHGAEGMFLAFTYWQLSAGWGLPWPLPGVRSRGATGAGGRAAGQSSDDG